MIIFFKNLKVIKCKEIHVRDTNLKMECSKNLNEFGTVCKFECVRGFRNTGSSRRLCVAIGIWSGFEANCKRKLITIQF